MFRPILLIFVLVLGGVLFGTPSGQQAAADPGECSRTDIQIGTCPEATGTVNNGGVDVSAGYENRTDGGGHKEGAAEGNVSIEEGQQNAANNAPSAPFGRGNYTINCTLCDPSLVVRISDLVNFRPITPTQGMEPAGWMVIGLPTNFIGAASVHTLSGLLLGFPADVRFTPVRYRWDYGDGSTGSSGSGGASWEAQSLPEFSETATSHRYRESGRHAIALTVVYAAEYRFAGQLWQSIQGTLAVPADPLTALAGEARTVLVDRECTGNPRGPGC